MIMSRNWIARLGMTMGLSEGKKDSFVEELTSNPRHPINAVTLRSGRQLTPHLRKKLEELDRAEKLEEVQPDPDDKEAESESHESIDRQQQESFDRHHTHPDPQLFKSFEPVVSRVYEHKAPYPPNQVKVRRELDKAICKKAFDKIIVGMPLTDAIQISPPIKKYMKDMVTGGF